MKKIINKGKVSGVLYEHDLRLRETGANSKNPGTKYISGTIGVATDDAQTNIVPVHFSFVTATTKAGNENATFATLKKIIDGDIKSVMDGGKALVRVEGEVALNDFYTERNNEVELVSAKRFEGKFIHVMTTPLPNENERNVMELDMLITGVRTVEATDTKPAKTYIKGAIFNDYRKSILPVEFSVVDKPNAIAYFESLDASASTPVFTRIKSCIVSETIKRQILEESAFGDPEVREVSSSRRDWVAYWAQPETYVWDSEETITADEVKKAMADREIYLADIKKRYEDFKATKSAPAGDSKGSAFNF